MNDESLPRMQRQAIAKRLAPELRMVERPEKARALFNLRLLMGTLQSAVARTIGDSEICKTNPIFSHSLKHLVP
jgi:hypothetical protein